MYEKSKNDSKAYTDCKQTIMTGPLSPLQSSEARPASLPDLTEPQKAGGLSQSTQASQTSQSSHVIESSRPTGAARPATSSPPHRVGGEDNDSDDDSKDDSNDDSDRPHLIAIPWPETTKTPVKPKPARPDFPIRWPSICGRDFQVKTEEYDFGAVNELSIQEAIHKRDGHYKRVEGWIHVTKAPADQAAGTIQAKMTYAVSPEVDLESVPHSSTKTGITIGDSSFMDGFDGIGKGTYCLGMSIVLYMAPGVSLDTLDISALHMGMQIHNEADFSVKNSTSISLTSGTIQAAALKSRSTHLQTISGSISGKYSLSDLLLVTTKSGSVNINVEPEALEKGHTSPAVFKIDALSSSVRVDFQRKNIPERDYQTIIETTAGSVDGRFIHGSRTEIRSEAGFVKADLLPFKSGDYHSELYTNTHSGQTNLTLRAPYKAQNMPLKGLISTHKTTSGGLNVWYPEEWMGFVDGTSLSGALHLQGNDLVLLNQNDKPGQNHVEARKGGDGSLMAFDTMNGGCEVTIGKV